MSIRLLPLHDELLLHHCTTITRNRPINKINQFASSSPSLPQPPSLLRRQRSLCAPRLSLRAR